MLAYLKRYIFGLLVPVAATEADDDGQRAAKGQDDDEEAQAALLDAKRKEREERLAKMKAEGRYTKVAPLADCTAKNNLDPIAKEVIDGTKTLEEAKALVAAGLAPAEPPKQIEDIATVPPVVPKHLQDMMLALDEEGIPVDKFVKWATSPRDYEKKGRLLPEGTKFENFTEDLIKAILQPNKWAAIRKHLK